MGRLTKVITEFRKTFDSLLFSKQKFSKNYPDAKKTSDIPGWADSNEGRSLKLVKHILKDVSGDDVMAVWCRFKKKHWEITKGIFSLVIWPGPVFDPRNGGGVKKFSQFQITLGVEGNM